MGATPQHQTTLELVVINPLDAFFYIPKRWTGASIIQGIITGYGINKPCSKEVDVQPQECGAFKRSALSGAENQNTFPS